MATQKKHGRPSFQHLPTNTRTTRPGKRSHSDGWNDITMDFNGKYIDSFRGPHFPASELLDYRTVCVEQTGGNCFLVKSASQDPLIGLIFNTIVKQLEFRMHVGHVC